MELKESFETEVLAASEQKPVLVDFWAPWCGPCQILGPVLEEVAQEKKDQLELIKVNVDHHQNLATEYGVRGIPHVTLFHKGQVIDSFSGARTQPQVMEWLNEHMPSKEKDDWRDIRKKWSEVPAERAILDLKHFNQQYPSHEDAKVLLARHLSFFNPEEAADYVADIKMESDHYDMAQYVIRLSQYRENAHYLAFTDQYIENDLLHAFKYLNNAVLKADQEEGEQLEKIGVALYSIANSKSPDLIKARKVFDMYTST